MDFFKGHIVPTTPVNIADTFYLLTDDEAKAIFDTWNEEELIETIKRKLIVKQAMESKLRETPNNDNIIIR